jgi:hypothetical protein
MLGSSQHGGADFRESSVTNPLAFRYLCLDFAIWKRGNTETQVTHLQMILSLIEQSRHRLFNLRRLNKMRTFWLYHALMIDVVKKMLFALRSGIFPREILPSFITALRAVVKASFSTEVVRTLATFVTSFSQKGALFGFRVLTLGKPSKTPLSRAVNSNSPVKRSATFGDESMPKRSRNTSNARDGVCYEVVVLEMLVDVLLSPEKRYINKFATTITSKV